MALENLQNLCLTHVNPDVIKIFNHVRSLTRLELGCLRLINSNVDVWQLVTAQKDLVFLDVTFNTVAKTFGEGDYLENLTKIKVTMKTEIFDVFALAPNLEHLSVQPCCNDAVEAVRVSAGQKQLKTHDSSNFTLQPRTERDPCQLLKLFMFACRTYLILYLYFLLERRWHFYNSN